MQHNRPSQPAFCHDMRDAPMNGAAAAPARALVWGIAATAVIALAAQIALFWPGIMVWDAIRQYGQALSGHYDDWHPPAMNWLWRQLLAFGNGPAPMLVVQAALYWGGLGLMAVDAARRRQAGLAIAILAVALLPVSLVLVGTILKDSLMAGALLLATGLIGWHGGGAGWRRIAAAMLLLAAATLRFNAVPACLPLVLALIPHGWTRGAARWSACAVVSTALLFAAMPLANRLLHAEKSGVELSLVIYDLGGITRFSGQDAFPPLPVADTVAVNAACYTPESWDIYAWWGPAPCPIGFANVRAAFAAQHLSPTGWWAKAALHHPIAYAAHRLNHFNDNSRLLVDERALHHLSRQSDPNDWGFVVPPDGLRDRLGALADASLWTPLGWPLVSIALAFAVLILLPTAVATMARPLAWSALLYGLSYLPLSVATEVRYHFWTITAGALAAAYALALPEVRNRLKTRYSLPALTPLAIVLAVASLYRLL